MLFNQSYEDIIYVVFVELKLSSYCCKYETDHEETCAQWELTFGPISPTCVMIIIVVIRS